MNPVVVIPAFRRAFALRRLLEWVRAADHPPETRFVVSLEGGSLPEVRQVAERFQASRAGVEIMSRDERLGLRDHILACGDLSLEHGAVIVLEDDLVVDRYYYRYASRALDAYAADPAVGGIALYGYEYNELGELPFTPLDNGWCTFPLQVPCSWGQAWTREQWLEFRKWYRDHHREGLERLGRLPQAIRAWPESSWKKYYAAYLVDRAKTFVYPYRSYTTNCADPGGTHSASGTHLLQVRLGLQERNAPDFRFCPLDRPAVAYDAFMEPCGSHVFAALGLDPGEVELDLMGLKPVDLLREKPLAVTSKHSAAPLKSFPLIYRPVEQNLRFPRSGAAGGPLLLTRTGDIVDGRPPRRSLPDLSYYARMPLMSPTVAGAVVRGLPGLALRKLGSMAADW